MGRAIPIGRKRIEDRTACYEISAAEPVCHPAREKGAADGSPQGRRNSQTEKRRGKVPLTSEALSGSRKCSEIVAENESAERTNQCGREQALVQ